MAKQKLVSNRQGEEFARMMRQLGVTRSTLQKKWLTNGRARALAQELCLLEWYPDFVHKCLTPHLEVSGICDPGEVELWYDSRQESHDFPTGLEVYEAIKSEELLGLSLSFGELKFLEENPGQIPFTWPGNNLCIYAWASVVQDVDGTLFVPFLDCENDRPRVDWNLLEDLWNTYWPAGLRVS